MPALTTAGVIHLGAVVPALGIGAVMLTQRKGTAWHKVWGRVWVALMIAVDISAFWLQRDGYSWIHLFAVVNLISISAAIVCVRYKRRVAHAGFVIGAYSGTVAAGFGAFASDRFLNSLLFGA